MRHFPREGDATEALLESISSILPEAVSWLLQSSFQPLLAGTSTFMWYHWPSTPSPEKPGRSQLLERVGSLVRPEGLAGSAEEPLGARGLTAERKNLVKGH